MAGTHHDDDRARPEFSLPRNVSVKFSEKWDQQFGLT
jgi:hypothetical protein